MSPTNAGTKRKAESDNVSDEHKNSPKRSRGEQYILDYQLAAASQRGDLGEVVRLIDAGANPNTPIALPESDPDSDIGKAEAAAAMELCYDVIQKQDVVNIVQEFMMFIDGNISDVTERLSVLNLSDAAGVPQFPKDGTSEEKMEFTKQFVIDFQLLRAVTSCDLPKIETLMALGGNPQRVWPEVFFTVIENTCKPKV